MIRPPLMVPVALLAIAVGGCGTTLGTNETPSTDLATPPGTTPAGERQGTNFGSATPPRFGPQLP